MWRRGVRRRLVQALVERAEFRHQRPGPAHGVCSSATGCCRHSSPATDAPFCSAERTTRSGSMMPISIMFRAARPVRRTRRPRPAVVVSIDRGRVVPGIGCDQERRLAQRPAARWRRRSRGRPSRQRRPRHRRQARPERAAAPRPHPATIPRPWRARVATGRPRPVPQLLQLRRGRRADPDDRDLPRQRPIRSVSTVLVDPRRRAGQLRRATPSRNSTSDDDPSPPA